MKRPLSFFSIIAKLQAHYGKPRAPTTTDPLGLLVYETVAYLASDEKRDLAFAALRSRTDLKPTEILAVPLEDLMSITELGGGIRPDLRAARLQEIAHIVMNDFAGDLRSALRLPFAQARKALQKFPSIGPPGAEKVLLFTKSYPVLALESNGLRVLLRLGFAEERRDYTASYRAMQEALKDQIGDDCGALISAYQLLRLHGKQLCRTNNPACEICPVNASCEYYARQ
jgi:endonuclease-3